MDYVATITLDYTDMNRAEYQKLLVAIEHAGWDYTETSAMIYEGDDIDVVRRGLALLGKAVHLGGTLSALSIQVQGVGATRPAPTYRNRPNAYRSLMALPNP